MEAIFNSGELVAWKTSSNGVTSIKCGRVIGVIPKGCYVEQVLPDINYASFKLMGERVSFTNTRYCVEVERVGKSGFPLLPALYYPSVNSVHRGMANGKIHQYVVDGNLGQHIVEGAN